MSSETTEHNATSKVESGQSGDDKQSKMQNLMAKIMARRKAQNQDNAQNYSSSDKKSSAIHASVSDKGEVVGEKVIQRLEALLKNPSETVDKTKSIELITGKIDTTQIS
jgi:DNA-binding response OmpR family regulator